MGRYGADIGKNGTDLPTQIVTCVKTIHTVDVTVRIIDKVDKYSLGNFLWS